MLELFGIAKKSLSHMDIHLVLRGARGAWAVGSNHLYQEMCKRTRPRARGRAKRSKEPLDHYLQFLMSRAEFCCKILNVLESLFC